MRRIVSFLTVVLMLLQCISNVTYAVGIGGSAEYDGSSDFDAIKTAELNSEAKCGYDDDESVRIMVQLEGKAALERGQDVKSAMHFVSTVKEEQDKAVEKIENYTDIDIKNAESYSLLFNGFAFDGKAGDIDAINSMDGMLAYVVPAFGLPEPLMDTSAGIVGAPIAWEKGMDGNGTTIAIIDTGIRESHEAFSVAPRNAKLNQSRLQTLVDESDGNMHAGSDVSDLYKSSKIPFGYDYYYDDYTPNHTASDHGTHVAGIAAGNDGGQFKGVAYNAQIVAMQVFSSSGSAPWDIILMALEDCVYLGVDSVNMSLGSPAGFSAYSDEGYSRVFRLLESEGVMVAAASGNDTSTALGNSRNGYQLAMNPDSGLVSSPSTYEGAVSVASSDNRVLGSAYFYAYGEIYTYNEPSSGAASMSSIAGSYDYVDCGLGYEDEIPGDLTGKIALVGRGELTFTEKAGNAAEAGAKAIIVYNNEAGNFSNINVSSQIPFATLSQEDGMLLIDKATDGVGQLEIKAGDAGAAFDNISSFSSIGTTSDLLIKPEITAPGGNITSAIGFSGDSSYGTWSGTSMATPHIAGGMAIVKAHIREQMPEISEKRLAEIATSILMGTATPMKNELVRAQGAGIMNLEAAINTCVYASVEGDRPKLEIGESDTYQWTFRVKLTNFGDEECTYSIDGSFMIDTPYARDISGDKSIYITNMTPSDVTELVTLTDSSEGNIVIPAGESSVVTLTMDASAVMEQYEQCFPVGTYIEGFIKFSNAGDVHSLPLLGYMGDWDEPSIFDRGFYWQAVTGETNLNSNGSINYNLAATQRNNSLTGVGFNPYVSYQDFDEFNPDWGAISPDNDGTCDSVSTIEYALLRNPKTVDVIVETPQETIELYHSGEYTFRKDLYYKYYYTYNTQEIDYRGEGLQEGETGYIKVIPTLDHNGYTAEANEMGEWVIPVTYDTTAPAVYVDGDRIGVYDEHYVAYIAVYSDERLANRIYAEDLYGETRGETNYIENMSGVVYVFAGDYAGNDTVYAVDMESGRVFTEALYGESFETDPLSEGWIFETEKENTAGWAWSSNSDFASAYEGVGCIYSDEIVGESNLAISRDITVTENNAYVSFAVNANSAPAQYRVLVRYEEGGEIIQDVILEAVAEANGWKIESADIHGYEGKSIQLVFEHMFSQDGGALLVDRVEVCQNENEKYMLTYMADGAEHFQTRLCPGDDMVIPDDPQKAGYRFVGWAEQIPETMPCHDVIVNAEFEKLPEYTVEFRDYDGSVIDIQSVTEGMSATAPEDPVREGHTFTGWDKDFSNVIEDMVVTALYQINTFTITYLDWDGTVIYVETVEYGASAQYDEVPEYKDHVFIQWVGDELTDIAGDVTVTAEYALLGDFNLDGLVNTGDATLILRSIAYDSQFTELERKLGDVTLDGAVNTGDATVILKYVAGMLTSFTDAAKE